MRDRPGITIYKFVFPTSISACGVSRVRVGIQVFKRELHTYIHLDYTRLEKHSNFGLLLKI